MTKSPCPVCLLDSTRVAQRWAYGGGVVEMRCAQGHLWQRSHAMDTIGRIWMRENVTSVVSMAATITWPSDDLGRAVEVV